MRFRRFLERFIGWHIWSRIPHDESSETSDKIDDEFLRRFVKPLAPEGGPAQENDQVMSFECSREKHSSIALRIEAHREYFSVTLYHRLEFELTNDKTLLVRSPPLFAGDRPFEVSVHYGDQSTGVLDVLYDQIAVRLIRHADADFGLYESIADLFPNGTFANFHGVTLPAKTLVAQGRVTPLFCEPSKHRLDSNADFSDTINFLSELWPQLKRNLFPPGTDDVIACYVQQGHAIYISALGSQTSPTKLDDLRYVVVYPGARHTSKRRESDEDQVWRKPGRQLNWRISRLVYRLHEAGTLRLAALRKLRRLRRAMHELTNIEQHVARYAWPTAVGTDFGDRVREALKMLAAIGEHLGEPVQYRLSRSRSYFRRSRAHAEELGVIKIPGWQSYSDFLKRRAYQTYEQIEAIGFRVDRILQIIQTQSVALQNTRMLLWQLTAAAIGVLGIPVLMGDAFQNLGWPQKDSDGEGSWPIGFVVGLVISALIGTLFYWRYTSRPSNPTP
ncbi:MAG: DUF3422 family protein [Hyphomonadaceae bacterium]|nr:DUF3422 family protein [Hyphomonadaceae bacterium]